MELRVGTPVVGSDGQRYRVASIGKGHAAQPLRVGASVVGLDGRPYRVARIEKYNENHDERGLFASGDSSGGGGGGDAGGKANDLLAIQSYMAGKCGAMAVALHEQTDHPIYGIFLGRDMLHAYVVPGEGNGARRGPIIDVKGQRSFNEMRRDIVSDAALTATRTPLSSIRVLGPITPGRVDATAGDINNAKHFIDRLKVLTKYNENHDEQGRFSSGDGGGLSSGAVARGAEHAGGVPAFLSMVTSMQGDHPSVDKFILRHGRGYLTDAKSYIGGEPHMCFQNATLAVLEDKSLTYVEGYIDVHGVPIHHAWTIDKSGTVRDPTLHDGRGINGYFGVPIKQTFMLASQLKSGVYGVLTHNQAKLILRSRPKEIVQG